MRRPKKACLTKKERALDAGIWSRDAALVETATLCRREIGGELYIHHDVFRKKVETAREIRPQAVRCRPQTHLQSGDLARRDGTTRHREAI